MLIVAHKYSYNGYFVDRQVVLELLTLAECSKNKLNVILLGKASNVCSLYYNLFIFDS